MIEDKEIQILYPGPEAKEFEQTEERQCPPEQGIRAFSRQAELHGSFGWYIGIEPDLMSKFCQFTGGIKHVCPAAEGSYIYHHTVTDYLVVVLLLPLVVVLLLHFSFRIHFSCL